MAAAAIAILLNSPLRMKNLSEARLGKEIIRRPGKNGRCAFDVRFLAPNTKNKRAIDAVISGKSAAILDQYIQKFRPAQAGGVTDALFPDVSGKPRQPGKFGEMISGRILKHTGLWMPPHCFRHLAAKIILDNDPGAVRKVQQVLNHKKISTTTSFYCDPNSEAAFEDYHDLLDKLWDE